MKKTAFARLKRAWPEELYEDTLGVYDPEVPGLVIAKVPAEKKAHERYSIYHAVSGRYVVESTFRTRKEAEVMLHLLANEADWEMAAPELVALDLRSRVWALDKENIETPA